MYSEYRGANVCGIVPGLLGGANLPDWMPPAVADASAVVVLVLDGLGWRQLEQRANVAPVLNSLAGGPISTVAPSTTATALSSIATGLTPAEHGILGYRMLMRGAVTNMLRWATDGAFVDMMYRLENFSRREHSAVNVFRMSRAKNSSGHRFQMRTSSEELRMGIGRCLLCRWSFLNSSGAARPLCTPTTRASTKLPMSEGSESFMTPNLHVPTEWLMTCSTVYRVARSCSSLPITAKSRSAIDFSTPLMIYFD